MDIYEQILKVKAPSVLNQNLRRESRKERAKAVRALFKVLGLKGISVTAPNYSMAQSIDVRLPRRDECPNEIHKQPFSRYLDCAECAKVHAAERRIEELILTAYPDLDDRSDSQSDHFDYCLSISS